MELAEVVGSLTALQRFPVEPLAGETPNAALVRGTGLLGDRVYDLCDAATGERLASREMPLALGYAARYTDELVEQDLDSWTRVRAPGGDDSAIGDPRWLADLGRALGRPLALRPHSEETAPLRIISRPTLRLVERTYGGRIEPVRVRANLVVEITDGKAFDEDAWIGRRIGIGDTSLEIVGPSGDAFVADFPTGQGQGDRDLLAGLVRVREGQLGVTARVLNGLRLRVGDPVALYD